MGKRSKKKHRKTSSQQVKIEPAKPAIIDVIENHPWKTLFFVLSLLFLIFYWPMIFEGKTYLPPDHVASRSFHPFIQGTLAKGVYPLWNPYIFGGMPSFGSLTAPFADPLNTVVFGVVWVIRQIFSLSDYINLQAFLQFMLNFFLLGGSIYWLLRKKEIQAGPALYAAVAVVFLPQVVGYTAFGHNTKFASVVLIPIILFLVDRLFNKRNLLYLSLTAAAIGIQLLRLHTQICYYTYLVIGIYFIWWSINHWREKKQFKPILQNLGLIAVAALAGLLLSSWIYLSVWEYSDYSIRGGSAGLELGYATNWSFPPAEILTFFVPSFMGFANETYWGPMPHTAFPLYFGIVTLMLGVLGLVLKRNKTTLFFAILGFIALLISFGKHLPVLYGPMFKFLPYFNKFRAPKMVQILLHISMAILAAFGIQGIIETVKSQAKDNIKSIQRSLLIFGGITFAILLILLVAKGPYLGWASKVGQNSTAAYDKAVSDALKALLLFGISAGAVWMTIKEKLNFRWFPVVLILVLVWDLWSVDNRFITFQPRASEKTYFNETPEVTFIKKQKETLYPESPFRIMTLGSQRSPNWYIYHGIEYVWGYHGAKLKTIQQLANAFRIPNGPEGFMQNYLKVEGGRYAWRQPSEIDPGMLRKQHVFQKLLNVRYILSPYPVPDTTMQVISAPQRQGQNAVMEYKEALPRVYFPRETKIVEGSDAILGYMADSDFDPAKTAIVETELPLEIVPSDSNRAWVEAYDIHEIKIKADVKTPSLMVLSEMYYPKGWKAFVDGEETDILKVNYAFRGMILEPGTHDIQLVFSPQTFTTGRLISICTLLLILGGVFIGYKTQNREKQPIDEKDEDVIESGQE